MYEKGVKVFSEVGERVGESFREGTARSAQSVKHLVVGKTYDFINDSNLFISHFYNIVIKSSAQETRHGIQNAYIDSF